MDIERDDPGHWHTQFGQAEKWIVGVGALALAALISTGWFSMQSKLENIQVQQAVTNAQLLSINSQMADIPGLRQKVAENTVVIKRNTDDIGELRRMKGLQ